MTKVIIVGAGIGGTACALALLKHGLDVTLLEQASAFGEVGAGVQMSPNANRVIDALGRLDAVLDVAVRPEAAVATIWDTGEPMRVIPYGEKVLERWGYPYIHLYRPDLITALSAGLSHVERLKLGYGYVVEARKEQELPEVMLGCCEVLMYQKSLCVDFPPSAA